MGTTISDMRPEAQSIATTWLHIVRDDLHIDARVLETLRSEQRQKDLQASGASLVKFGWHQVGLALVWACFRDGQYITDGNDRLYEQCGQVAEALGCVWGGRWGRLKDSGHWEYHPGFTLAQFLDGHKIGAV